MKKLIVCIALIIISSNVSFTSVIGSTKLDSNKSNEAETFSVSNYLGCLDIKLTEGTGFFSIAQDDNGAWWFVTPDGYAFYSVGLSCVAPDCRHVYNISIMAKYGSHAAWADAVKSRFNNWSFNTLGSWSKYDLFTNVPYTYQFISIQDARTKIARRLPDVWSPLWRELARQQIENVTRKMKDDPYLIGYFLDNELNWGPDIFDKNTLLEDYLSARHEKFKQGKSNAIDFLRERYQGNIEEFNRVWNMNLKSFDELYDLQDLGKEGWKAMHSPFNKRLRGDISAFNQYVAETYFSYVTSLLRENDPNHLILGVRFHAWGTPKEIIETCGRYCDVISINYYRYNRWLNRDLIRSVQCFLYGCIPPDNWMKRYFEISGEKPLIIGEFGCAARDSGQKKQFGGAVLLRKQSDRANYFEWYVRNCLKASYIVGYHWFSFVDKVEGGAINTNVGVVNAYDEEYDILVRRMADINKQAYELHR